MRATIERPKDAPTTYPGVKLHEVELPRHAREGPGPPRWRWTILAVVLALIAVGIGAWAYNDQVQRVDELEAQVASLEDQVLAQGATEAALRSEIAGLEETQARLIARGTVLRTALERTQLGRATLAERLATVEVRLATVQDRRAALVAYLGSLSLCSAAGMPALEAQAGLPGAVATMRTDIGEAALICDLVGLRQLAQAGAGTFWYGSGFDLPPGATWAVGEVQRVEPTRWLVGMLDLPFGTLDLDGRTTYVWPAAAAYQRWANVPAEDVAALYDWYTPQEIQAFEDAGVYTGARVHIRDNGNWTVFRTG